ncbi:class I SAM-dependent methyltransferase [Bradyrhizobium sp. CB1650]|uniref:class I SAM-dependent methyltransferase n=1 Tax=Bradyrhizobium sp. CB1650 TaxID=3039153 RepID=UPI002434E1C7|nr:class I SAM-dependent methyltransferase [Bradyrhizobium sp. CB1650]WGD55375.1 class I SAM-dependent methyltransferase [Bradyrhizobium sp. CB1650]
MNSTFAKSKAIADTIEGMLSPFSMAAMDSVLAFQAESHTGGDMVELGVLRGKSAAILAGRLSGNEKLHLYDIADYFDRAALTATGANLSFNIASTLDLTKRHFRDSKRAVRFCHIDASHMFEPTMHEMALADYMLADDGILCLDDYTNLNYSQILAAIFKYLFTKRTDLTMFMVTDEKAYLCRRSKFPLYAGFVLDSILAGMAERDISNVGIARTDDTPSYGAFYLRPKIQGEADDYYGIELYRHFYQIRDHSAPLAVAKRTVRRIMTRAGIRLGV